MFNYDLNLFNSFCAFFVDVCIISLFFCIFVYKISNRFLCRQFQEVINLYLQVAKDTYLYVPLFLWSFFLYFEINSLYGITGFVPIIWIMGTIWPRTSSWNIIDTKKVFKKEL